MGARRSRRAGLRDPPDTRGRVGGTRHLWSPRRHTGQACPPGLKPSEGIRKTSFQGSSAGFHPIPRTGTRSPIRRRVRQLSALDRAPRRSSRAAAQANGRVKVSPSGPEPLVLSLWRPARLLRHWCGAVGRPIVGWGRRRNSCGLAVVWLANIGRGHPLRPAGKNAAKRVAAQQGRSGQDASAAGSRPHGSSDMKTCATVASSSR